MASTGWQCSHIGTVPGGFLNDGQNLLIAVLHIVDRIAGGRHPTGGHKFDMMSAAAQLLARGPENLISAVRYDRQFWVDDATTAKRG